MSCSPGCRLARCSMAWSSGHGLRSRIFLGVLGNDCMMERLFFELKRMGLLMTVLRHTHISVQFTLVLALQLADYQMISDDLLTRSG